MDVEITTIDERSSDHNLIFLQLGEKQEGREEAEAQFTKKYVNWEKFRAILHRDMPPITPIHQAEEIEEAVATLKTAIREGFRAATTETRAPRRPKTMGDLPPEVSDLILDRQAAKRTAARTRLPEDRKAYNQLCSKVKAALEEHRQQGWSQFLESLDPGQSAMWNTQKILRKPWKPIPPIHGENGIGYTRQEKAEAFADSLELQCRENQTSEEDEDWEEEVERRARRLRREEDEDQPEAATAEEGHQEAQNQESARLRRH